MLISFVCMKSPPIPLPCMARHDTPALQPVNLHRQTLKFPMHILHHNGEVFSCTYVSYNLAWQRIGSGDASYINEISILYNLCCFILCRLAFHTNKVNACVQISTLCPTDFLYMKFTECSSSGLT